MCNRLGKKKFVATFGKTRSDVKREMASKTYRDTGRPLSSMYHIHMLDTIGFVDDKMFGYNNQTKPNQFVRTKLSKLMMKDRLDVCWHGGYRGKKKFHSAKAVLKTELTLRADFLESTYVT